MKHLFTPKPQHRIEVGGFIASFYFKENDVKSTYLKIDTISGIWSMRLDGRTYPFGYLYAAVMQGQHEQIHGYAALMYRTAMSLTQSQGFVDGLTKEINKLDKRLMKKAEKDAHQVSPEMEDGACALMEDIVSEQGLSKKELAEKRKADKEILKEVLSEKGEGV